jgi:tetraacyldisaccharide 4'-kinase
MRARELLLSLPGVPYGAAVAVRNWLFDKRVLASRRFDVPLVCVGNITVGGTGKTPHVEAILAALSREVRVGCISRGYGRRTSGFRLVDEGCTFEEVGDEPRQIKSKFPGVLVAVDGNRARGIERMLRAIPAPQVIVMDDGFQHRHVKPGLSIVLVDHARPLDTDHLLPRGRLREPATALRRADVVVVTKCPATLPDEERAALARRLHLLPGQRLFFSTMRHGAPVPLDGESPCGVSRESTVICLTGIARPAPYARFLEGIAGRVVPLHFPDHHRFTGTDLRRVIETFHALPTDDRFIFTTEKDVTRLATLPLPPEIRSRVFHVPVEVDFLPSSPGFIETITSYVRQNQEI